MPLQVQVVSPEEVLWSGDAERVITRTLGGGDIAFLPGHTSFMGARHGHGGCAFGVAGSCYRVSCPVEWLRGPCHFVVLVHHGGVVRSAQMRLMAPCQESTPVPSGSFMPDGVTAPSSMKKDWV